MIPPTIDQLKEEIRRLQDACTYHEVRAASELSGRLEAEAEMARIHRRFITDRGETFGMHRYLVMGRSNGGMIRWHTAATWHEAVAVFRATWLSPEDVKPCQP